MFGIIFPLVVTGLSLDPLSFQTYRPPIGATYAGSTRISFVGNQDVQLSILSRKRAQIQLNGIVNMNDNILYNVRNGAFVFEFSDHMTKVLNKYYCMIQNAMYKDDVASVEIYITVLRLRRRIYLHRKLYNDS